MKPLRLFQSYLGKTDGVIHYYDLKRSSNRIGVIIIYILTTIIALSFIYPMVWLLIASLKTETELYTNVLGLPQKYDWVGIRQTFQKLRFGDAYFWSIYQCTGAILCAVVLNGLTGYALGVVKMRGHKLIWGLCMALMLVPSAGGFVVLYRLICNLGLNQGQIWPLFLGCGGSCYNIMVFKTFFENIPRDYIDAARLDGANNVSVFFRIILPLSKPIVAITAINTFIGTWSDFLMPYLCLFGTNRSTVMVTLYHALNDNHSTVSRLVGLRGSLVSVLPPVIFFCIFQRYIMNNNTAAGVKG